MFCHPMTGKLCQPSSKFFRLGKDRAGKGEAWAQPFISCVQDTVSLTPTAPRAIRLRKTFTFTLCLHILIRAFAICTWCQMQCLD